MVQLANRCEVCDGNRINDETIKGGENHGMELLIQEEVNIHKAPGIHWKSTLQEFPVNGHPVCK
ncbi:hypothetical protein PRBEI_2000029400 [Prionailurus iriomotensis]